MAFTANNLWDNPGARRIPKQVGRGQGSGKGKTAGRGHKGTYARSGGSINRGFEGGQSTMAKRFPKRGFRANRFNTLEPLESINLGKLAYFIQKGQLDPKETISMKVLFETGILTKIKHGVKVLGQGADKLTSLAERLGTPINLEVTDASV